MCVAKRAGHVRAMCVSKGAEHVRCQGGTQAPYRSHDAAGAALLLHQAVLQPRIGRERKILDLEPNPRDAGQCMQPIQRIGSTLHVNAYEAHCTSTHRESTHREHTATHTTHREHSTRQCIGSTLHVNVVVGPTFHFSFHVPFLSPNTSVRSATAVFWSMACNQGSRGKAEVKRVLKHCDQPPLSPDPWQPQHTPHAV